MCSNRGAVIDRGPHFRSSILQAASFVERRSIVREPASSSPRAVVLKMEAMRRMLQGRRGGAGGGAAAIDTPLPDTAEKIQISSLSLLKMLKHGRAGVPMEVMGLMLGEFVDDYTITCVDVFAMPQVRAGGERRAFC